MRQPRFAQEQIIRVLREQESGAAFFKWKARHGGLDGSEARKLRLLEDGNA